MRLMRTRTARTSSAVTVQPLYEAVQLLDLLPAEALALRELSDEGGDPPAEQPVDEVAAFLKDVVLAGDQRTVEIAPPVRLGGDGPLFDEPRKKRADGAGRPFPI